MAVGEIITTLSCFARQQFVFWFTFRNIIWCLWNQQFISPASHVLVKQQAAVCVFQTHTVCFRVGIHFKYISRCKCVALSWRCAGWVEKNGCHVFFPGCHGDTLFTRNTPQEICPVKCSAYIFMTTKRKERLYVIISWTVSARTSEEVICYILQVTFLKSNGVDDWITC